MKLDLTYNEVEFLHRCLIKVARKTKVQAQSPHLGKHITTVLATQADRAETLAYKIRAQVDGD